MLGPIRDKLRAQRPEREVICAAIPHTDLALRWDIPCEMSQRESVFSVSAADLAIVVQGLVPRSARAGGRRPSPSPPRTRIDRHRSASVRTAPHYPEPAFAKIATNNFTKSKTPAPASVAAPHRRLAQFEQLDSPVIAAALPPRARKDSHQGERGVELERCFLNVGHEDYRPHQIEQSTFGNLRFERPRLGFGLADNGEIEAPRDAAELVACTSEARAKVSGSAERPHAKSRWQTGRLLLSPRFHCRAAAHRLHRLLSRDCNPTPTL